MAEVKKYPPDPADVLEGFRRWLNTERQANYIVVAQPDEVNRSSKDIDYVLEDRTRPPEVAVEVSSLWRSGEAGGEDDYFAKWFARVQARVQGQVAGTFHIGMPIRVPDGLDPTRFADDLLVVIDREKAALAAVSREGKGLFLDVQGIRVLLTIVLPNGARIDYARFKPDVSQFPKRVKTMLGEKAPKLRPYKAQGMETWIVVYNTAWTIMTPLDTQRVVASLLGPEHAHVDHVGICIADPPDDGWMIVVR